MISKTMYHFQNKTRNMKRLISIHSLYLLLTVAFFAACSDDKEDNPQPATPAIEWATGQSSPTFETSGGTASVHFSSTTDWTAEVDQDWCSVSPASGTAGENCAVTVSATPNETTDERNATLIVRSGTVTERMTIVQKQKDALTVTSNRIEVPADGGNATVEVQANIDFTYEIDEAAAEWLTEANSRALTTTQLHFTVAPNEAAEKREGKIVIRSGELSETVTVYQDGFTPQLVLTQNEHTVSSEGETVTIEVRSNVDYEMKLPAGVEWISEANSRALSTYTHRIQVAPNEDYDFRTAKIAFVSEEMGLTDTVTITQVQLDAILVAQPQYTVAPEGGTLEFAVNTNVDFAVETSADWIRQAPRSRALEEVLLSFIVDANTGTEDREATITLTADNVKQVIKVNQPVNQEPSFLRISFTGSAFTAPLMAGTFFTEATIAWGDGQSEAYKEKATHTYGNEGTYTVTIESKGANSFAMDDLTGVDEIDLSDF